MTALRRAALPIGALATILILLLVNPWVELEGTVKDVVTVAFWISSIVLVIALFEDRNLPGGEEIEIEGPAFARFLFNNSRAGLLWLPIRLFVGFEWLEAGWRQAHGPGWVDGGAALAGFWEGAAKIPEHGPPADHLRVVSRLHQLPDLNGHHETGSPGSSRSVSWRSVSA